MAPSGGSLQQRALAVKALMLRRTIVRAKQTARAARFESFAIMIQQQNLCALVAAQSSLQEGEERRVVHRALGKWRGSTLAGYLRDGDDQTYLENFRCTRIRFEALVEQLAHSRLDTAAAATVARSTDWRKVRRAVNARAAADPPTRRFKVAVALYATGQGGPIKVLADAAFSGILLGRHACLHANQRFRACLHLSAAVCTSVCRDKTVHLQGQAGLASG